jgi:hypothetical protein
MVLVIIFLSLILGLIFLFFLITLIARAININTKKKKIIISLMPFYLLILFVPFLIDSVWSGFADTKVGFFPAGFSVIGYLIFLLILFPFYHIFEVVGLVKMKTISMTVWDLPDISLLGYIILPLIYSCIIYVIVSFMETRKKKKQKIKIVEY